MIKLLPLFLFCMGMAGQALSQAKLGPRHVYILESLLDPEAGQALRITYLFGVESDASDGPMTVFPLIPRTVDEFRALEGAPQQDYKMDESGRVYLESEFPSGLTMMAIGMMFRTKTDGTKIPVNSENPMGILEILWHDANLKVDGLGLGDVEPVKVGEKPYYKRTWTSGSESSELNLEVSGFSEGRFNYWLIGGVFFALLVAGGVVFGISTKPSVRQEDQILA